MASKIHVFDPEVYPRKLFVVKGKDKANVIRSAFTKYDKTILGGIDEAREACGACTYHKVILKDTGMYGILVWIVTDYSPASLAHEAVHVVDGLFNEVGVDMSYDHDEHYAYMVQWVTDCLWQVVTGKIKD